MVNIVVALATESRPLIDHFRLAQDRAATGFRVFQGDGITLVVTGTGRVASAAGVAMLAGLGRSSRPGASAWLNVGIAGHADYEVGTGVHAVSIREAATGRTWYPPRIVDLPGCGETVCTVDVPETEYPDPYVYDMEASGFYATALRFSTGELIQVYKIISDNRSDGVDTVGGHWIRDSVTRQLPAIEAAVAALSTLAAEVEATRPKLAEFDHIISRWHFSVAQQHRLRSLLRRWEVLSGDAPLLDAELNRCPSAKSLLAEIAARLDAAYGPAGTSGD